MIAAALLMLAGAAADLTEPYRAITEPPKDAQLKAVAIDQPYFPGYQLWTVSGWAAGGHRELPTVAFAVQGRATVFVVRAETENADPDGYHQRVKQLWLCPVEHEQAIRVAGMDVTKAAKLLGARAKVCTSLFALAEERLTKAFAERQPAAWFDGFAQLLGTLAGEHRSMRVLRKQSDLDPKGPLTRLFSSSDGGVPHDAAWVKGPMAFAPWVTLTEGARFAGLGMAVDDQGGLALLEVRFEPRYARVRRLDGGTEPPDAQNHLTLSRNSVAFTRRFIE